jgi:glycosyltransferase involved in cell wall biosynthesis
MTTTAIFTIVSNNYLHFARTLLKSVVEQHPEAKRYCVIVDRDLSHARELSNEFETIPMSAINLPDGDNFIYQYTILELNTAVKPWAMQYLLKAGYDEVIYIDPDIRLYRPLNEVIGLLRSGSDIVLTPHLLEPIREDYKPTELDIRRAGTYNLGFCAVRSRNNVHSMLEWWQGKLRHDCVIEFEKGIFVDQSWMDLVPGLFERVAILRHQGYNVAYWNIGERLLVRKMEEITVKGDPLVFFHFSGMNPENTHPVSKHQNRFTYDNLNPVVRDLFEDYAKSVIANGIDRYKIISYGFSCYDNGEPIADLERVRFRKDAYLQTECGGRPFAHPELLSVELAPQMGADGEILGTVDRTDEQRVQKLFNCLLGRKAESAAVSSFGPRMGSKLGMARAVLAVGLSVEARHMPGWPARLLRFVNEVQYTPRRVRKLVTGPLERLFNRLGRHWSFFAYRPPHAVVSRHGQARASLRGDDDEPGPASSARMLSAPITPINQLPSPTGINLVGYVKAELGVGEAARSLARACRAADVDFSIFDVGFHSSSRQNDTSIVAQAVDRHFKIDMLYVNADQTPATARHLRSDRSQRADYTIGFWHWEQPELPIQYLNAFAHVNEVWAPTSFVQDALASVSPVPVYKVPHSLELQVSTGVKRSDFGLPDGQLLVLVMYDFHSYQYRKNPQAAIEAFRIAVKQNPNLGLVLKTINSDHYQEAYTELKESVANLPHVYFIDEFFSRQQTWNLQSCCEILLSLHRAEGFGLAPAEMMYLGKSVIATGWSGNMDFMTHENSMPVKYELKPLDVDLGAYPAGPFWAEADIEHAAWCLNQLVSQPDLMVQIGRRAAKDIQAQFSPAAAGKLVRQRLQVLGHWYPNLLD